MQLIKYQGKGEEKYLKSGFLDFLIGILICGFLLSSLPLSQSFLKILPLPILNNKGHLASVVAWSWLTVRLPV